MENSKPPGVENEPTITPDLAVNERFPEEAFECPHCGQLLAPTCRVCVSCKLPIDPARVQRQQAAKLEAAEAPVAPPEPPPVRFSWRMFFAVLAVTWLASALVVALAGLMVGQLLMSGVQLGTALWVFFDARQKLIRKPLRWAVGSLILWIIIFPWYLVRRRELDASCPFVEAESGPFTKAMLLVIFIFFMIALIVALMGGPASKGSKGKDGLTVVLAPGDKP
jgi:hypothetical protein